MRDRNKLKTGGVPLEMSPDEFRQAGHRLVDQIAEFLESLPNRPVTTGETPSDIRNIIGQGALPERGSDALELLDKAAHALFDHSLLSGSPNYLGYIFSSAAPIGALAEMLAATTNPNSGAWILSPVATEIELQTIRWIAELIGYDPNCGGILVSGGNMANFVGFMTARCAKTDWDVRTKGLRALEGKTLRAYASAETHTWLSKAGDLFGLGTEAARWIPIDSQQRMDTIKLREQIEFDIAQGDKPFMVIGAAGTVATGAIDPLGEIANICKEYNLWFHVDGAYGAFAAALPDAPEELKAMKEADSIAIDPHKWLYAPLEAGCTLVKNFDIMRKTFSYRPSYYKFDDVGGEEPLSFVDHGPQNSRGFRALKVWLGLLQAGRSGYEQMISDDIELARHLYQLADDHPQLEAFTHSLSITTFRYRPSTLDMSKQDSETYLNELNLELLSRIQQGGEVFVSNAVIDGAYVLRACIVNFRTTVEDIEMIPDIVCRLGQQLDKELRPLKLKEEKKTK